MTIKLRAYFSVLIAGIGIGWFLGLSVSPIVSIVITSVTGSAAAIITALSGLESNVETNLAAQKRTIRSANPGPIAMLIFGIVLGSTLGILARNQNWLGSDISGEVVKWERSGINKSREEIASRLFETQYPMSATVSIAQSTSSFRDLHIGTMLFSVTEAQCNRLLATSEIAKQTGDDREFLAAIEISSGGLPKLPVIVTDTKTLYRIVEEVICANDPAKP